MAKKKFRQRITVFGSIEGEKEERLLRHLELIYDAKESGINLQLYPGYGGDPNKIIREAIKCQNRKRTFAWFDEDFEVSNPVDEFTKRQLANFWRIKENEIQEFLECPIAELQSKYNPLKRNPNIIISSPGCGEAVILKIFDKNIICRYTPRFQESQNYINYCKTNLKRLIGISSEDHQTYYKTHLTKQLTEIKRKEIQTLDLLISMLTNTKK